jgi:hypothetical protein
MAADLSHLNNGGLMTPSEEIEVTINRRDTEAVLLLTRPTKPQEIVSKRREALREQMVASNPMKEE